MSDDRQDTVWQGGALVRTFLEGVRGGIPLAAEQIDAMLRLLGATTGPVARVLDLGCGDGVLAAAVRGRYPDARITLVDFSEPMLAAARARFADPNPAAGGALEFVRADFGDTGWLAALPDAAPFDVVVSGYAIHHQPDARKRALYAEVFGLLRPGGVFVNVEHVASGSPRLAALSDDLFVDTLTAFHARAGTGKGRDEVAREFVYRPDKAANILAPVEDQCAWLRAIGFVDVECAFKVFELAVLTGWRSEQEAANGRR